MRCAEVRCHEHDATPCQGVCPAVSAVLVCLLCAQLPALPAACRPPPANGCRPPILMLKTYLLGADLLMVETYS